MFTCFGGEHMFICTLTDGEKAEKAKGQIAKHWTRLLVLIPWEIPAVHLSWQCCSLWSMQVLRYAIKLITLYRRSSSRNVVLLNSVWIFNWIPELQYLIIFQPVLWFLNLQPFVASQFASVCLNTHPKPRMHCFSLSHSLWVDRNFIFKWLHYANIPDRLNCCCSPAQIRFIVTSPVCSGPLVVKWGSCSGQENCWPSRHFKLKFGCPSSEHLFRYLSRL